MDLSGIFPPLTTPFGADGALDLTRLRENIAKYNRTRLAGYVLNGSTGESVLLRWNEVERVWALAREAAAPGKILIAGTGAESTAETLEHTNRAAALGYQAALVRTPHYYKPQMTLEAEAEHFLRVADASRIPVLVYSVPVFTGVAVEAPLIERVANHPNILGIKESSGSLERIHSILDVAPKRFQVLVGSAAILEASLRRGAAGAVLAVACALPEICMELYETLRSGDTPRSGRLQGQLAEIGSVVVTKHGIPGLKYALDRLGYYGGPPRRPLLPLSEAAKGEIDDLLLRHAVPKEVNLPSVNSARSIGSEER